MSDKQTLEEAIQQAYDDWFYKFATKEPDETYTLVLHEVHDGGAYTVFEQAILALVKTEVQKAKYDEED